MKTTENTVHAAARVQQSGNPSVEYVITYYAHSKPTVCPS